MRMGLGGLKEMDLATRVLYRSRHIYILCSSLVHLAMGSYLFASKSRAGRFLQRVGSALLFLASTLLVVAFFREPQTGIGSTPFSRYGLITLLAGTLCHALPLPGGASERR